MNRAEKKRQTSPHLNLTYSGSLDILSNTNDLVAWITSCYPTCIRLIEYTSYPFPHGFEDLWQRPKRERLSDNSFDLKFTQIIIRRRTVTDYDHEGTSKIHYLPASRSRQNRQQWVARGSETRQRLKIWSIKPQSVCKQPGVGSHDSISSWIAVVLIYFLKNGEA